MRRFEKINTLTERTLPTILAIVIPELKLYFEFGFGLKSSFRFALQFGVADKTVYKNGDKWSKSIFVIKTVTFVKITVTFVNKTVTIVKITVTFVKITVTNFL